MADLIIKAESKHYNAWLRQPESSLIDGLLMFNGFYCEKPASTSSVTYLFKVMDDQSSKLNNNLVVPKGTSLIYFRVEKVLRLIHEERMLTIKASNLFKSETHYKNCLMNLAERDPELFFETTIIPVHFISRLTEYKGLMLPELRKEFNSIIREPIEKPTDQREIKTAFLMLFTMSDHYKYDPKAKKNTATKTIMKSMERKGHHRSLATIKRILDKAARISEEELDPKNKSL